MLRKTPLGSRYASSLLHAVCSFTLISLPLALTACTGGGGPVVGTGTGTGGSSGGGGGVLSGNPSGVGVGDLDGGGNDVPTGGGDGTTGGGDGTTGGDGGSGGGGGGGGSGTASVDIDPGIDNSVTTRAVATFSGSPNSSGELIVSLNLLNTTSFQSVVAGPEVPIVTAQLLAPNSATVLSADANNPLKTTALAHVEGFYGLNALPYRTSGNDPGIVDGTYTQELLFLDVPENSLDDSLNDSVASGALIAKRDNDLGVGALRVFIYLAGEVAQRSTSRNAIDSAVAVWEAIYMARGITLDVQIRDVALDSGILPNPAVGSSFYESEVVGAGGSLALNVFVAEEVSQDGTSLPGNTFTSLLGIAPSIPGPGIATTRSAVAVSLLTHRGADNNFSAGEIRLLGETFAHEVGHYLGLAHPVTCDCSTSPLVCGEGFDSLTDTGTCAGEDCDSNGVSANLMFPCGSSTVVQETVTADQGLVMNLQAIVD